MLSRIVTAFLPRNKHGEVTIHSDFGAQENKVCHVIPFYLPGSGEGNGNPLQYSCLEIPMDGGAWWAVVHGVAKSRT